MMRWPLCVIAFTGICLGQVPDYRVGLYTQQPPSHVTISPAVGGARWAGCASCAESTVTAPLEIDGVAGMLRVAGQKRQYPAVFLIGAYHLRPTGHAAIEARFPLEIRAQGNKLQLIMSLPLEEYVEAVLAAESGNEQPDQSLQAMAVAVRTYAVHFRRRHKAEGFDYCDTTHCQDFRFSAINERIRAAAEATEGEMLWYEGQPAVTYYHQNCGGNIADASEVWPGPKVPYLREHLDPYCSRANGGSWHSTIAKSDIDRALRSADIEVPTGWTSLLIESRNPTGRAVRLLFVAGGTRTAVSASSFRFAVNRALGWNQVRSDLYEIRDSGNDIVFTGRGSGHGVGLCQAGAEEMARENRSYRDILAFYYPGTVLGVTAQGLSWQLESSEHVELLTTRGQADASMLPLAESAMSRAEAATGLRYDFRPRLKIYPTLDAYRDSTGEPGWVAATTRGRTIRLQPVPLLRAHAVLESTLYHELLHLLVEAHAHPGLPLWFREGLVLYLGETAAAGASRTAIDPPPVFDRSQDRRQTEQAYAAARARVATLVHDRGKETVLGWLSRGLPADLGSTTAVGAQK